ncbi:MAG: MinD/ParA family protein [Gammaproteobacteria bacterium]
MTSVIAITSGKGGVGKTNITTNLGLALASRKAKVCVFDADTGLANINILLGISPEYTLEHVLNGEKTITEITVDAPGGIAIVPAASGIQQCTDLDERQLQILTGALEQLENSYDYILIDTAAGIDSNVLEFVCSAKYKVLVVTPEPTSLTDAFALLKMLLTRGVKTSIFILVNMVKDYQTSQRIYSRFQAAAKKYLKTDVYYLGYLAQDPVVTEAVNNQNPVVLSYPHSTVSCCFTALADVVKKQLSNHENTHGFSRYWKKFSRQEKTLSAPGDSARTAGYRNDNIGQLLRLIQQENVDSLQIKNLLEPLITAYNSKFPPPPETVFNEFYGFLNTRGYLESEVKEIVFTLESIFEKKYGRPIRNIENIIAGILADVYGSEDKIRLLQKTLEQSYQRQFNKKLVNPPDVIVRHIHNSAFTKDEYKTLQIRLGQAYLDRFGEEYADEREILINEMKRLIAEYDLKNF